MSSLGPLEKVLFLGVYNVNGFSTYSMTMGGDPGGESAYGYVDMTIQTKPLLKTTVFNTGSVGAVKDGQTLFLAEQYTANTMRGKNSRGQITWSATYPNGAVDTSGGEQNFMVTGKSGIYRRVTRVAIDFSETNGIRRVYFIGHK